MYSESDNFYFAPMQYWTLYLWIVSKWMLTGKRPNQMRHGGGYGVKILDENDFKTKLIHYWTINDRI